MAGSSSYSVNLVKSLMRGVKGQRLKGVFDHMKQEEFAMLRGELVGKIVVLGKEARRAGLSCGTVIEVGGSVGAFMQGRSPLAPSGNDVHSWLASYDVTGEDVVFDEDIYCFDENVQDC